MFWGSTIKIIKIMENQITEIFKTLNAAEQQSVIKKLNQLAVTSENVAYFSQWHQKKYSKNAIFAIHVSKKTHDPIVAAKVFTAFGEFTGEGVNKKLAKLEAVKSAKKALE
jgi:hypothetical protein